MVSGRNCDNCVGYVPVPVGVAGPLRMGVVGEGGVENKGERRTLNGLREGEEDDDFRTFLTSETFAPRFARFAPRSAPRQNSWSRYQRRKAV